MLSPHSLPASQPRPSHRAEPAAHRAPRLTLAAVCAGLLILGAGVLEPTASATRHPATAGPDSDAVRAASLLADDVGGTAYFSPALVDELGYAPALEGDSAARADGDCSSPIPLPSSFEPACRTHDLGYDLLRVAHRQGTPLPEGLRRELDARLSRDMHDSCSSEETSDGGFRGRIESAGCHAMASIAYKAVQANTLRQSNGAPVEETFPW